jgi:hypothetical protein
VRQVTQEITAMKKSLFVLMMALGLLAAAPAARAELDLPTCFPCGK